MNINKLHLSPLQKVFDEKNEKNIDFYRIDNQAFPLGKKWFDYHKLFIFGLGSHIKFLKIQCHKMLPLFQCKNQNLSTPDIY